MSDLIDRQQAIDAMGKAKWAKERLMELPPAQPESVLTCEGCRYEAYLQCRSCRRKAVDLYEPE